MRNSNGFFLIELLTYLAIFSFLMILLMRSFTSTAQRLGIDTQNAFAIAQLYATEQLMLRELEKAPTEQSNWCCLRADEIVWHANDKYIGWCFADDTLVRKEGSYNREEQKWSKKKTSIGAKQIKEGEFSVTWSSDKEEPQLLLVIVSIKTDNQDHTFCVSPRNRVIT